MSNQITTKGFFNKDSVKKKFEDILGQKAPAFIASVLQVTTSNNLLANADPTTVYTAAMIAATLDLPINQNLGFAWIVPYRGKAQFQMGWKGFVQLAQRTGQYKSINVVEVYESQFESFNALTEELRADFTKPEDGGVVGYCAYFKLLNGFEKTVYWSKEKTEAHGSKYSQSYAHKSAPWQTDFDAMAKKTVLKNALSKWGILSVEMQQATQADQGVINNAETLDVDYVDNTDEPLQGVENFEQLKQGVELGTTTVEQIQLNFDITEEQLKELESIKPKK